MRARRHTEGVRDLSTGEAAHRLGLSPHTVRRLVHAGALVPSTRTPGGYLRFAPATVEAYVRTRTITATAAPALTPRTADERLRRVYHALASGVVVLDPQGRVVEANAAAEEILGVRLGDLHGHILSASVAVVTRADGSPLPLGERPAMVALRTRRPVRGVVMRLRPPDGRERCVQIDAVPLLDAAGAVDQLVVSYVDLTARMYAEEALRASEERLRAVVTDAPIILCALDAAGTITLLEGRGVATLRRTDAVVVGHPAREVFAAWPAVLALAQQALAGDVARGEVTIGGTVLDMSYTPVHARDGALAGAISVSTDITALTHERTRLAALLTSAQALAGAVERDEVLHTLAACLVGAVGAVNAAFTHVDLDARRCKSLAHHAVAGHAAHFADDPWESLDDYPEVEAAFRARVPFHGAVDDPAFPPKEAAYLQRHGLATELLLPLVVGDTAVGVLEVHWAHSRALDDDTIGLCATIATQAALALERTRLYADAQARALRDSLTGLPNREHLHARLAALLGAATGRPARCALLLLDLDRFKEVNDTLGHPQGDALLRQVADRVRGVVRASDTVARLGGDEFAVLLAACDEEGARGVARDIGTALDPPFALAGLAVHVGTSIGIALSPAHGADGTTLLRHADVALYAAKRGGTGHVVYGAEQDAHSSDRLADVAALRASIAGGDLRLQYQPQMDLRTRQVCGVEALVRWFHPQRGLVPPDQFIGLAEQTGLIGALTGWVLEAALRQACAWRRAGCALLPVAVNLSMASLQDPHLPDLIAGLLDRYAVPPAALRLEVTESMLMADTARTQDILARVTVLGVTISIDDYGTGYSSLAYLKRLPIAELKIDRAFVRQMTNEATDAVIVRSTVELGHNLGLRVVAEGVETRAVWEMLAEMGCDAAQGYYLARPLPAEELERWLRAASGTAA